MTVAPLEFEQQSSPAFPSLSPYVPLPQLAAELQLAETTLLRLIWDKEVVSRPRRRGKGYEINVLTLPAKYRSAAVARHPELFADDTPQAGESIEDRIDRYVAARESVQTRADKRLMLVRSLRNARAERCGGETLAEVEERWFRKARRWDLGIKFSIRSVKVWSDDYAAAGMNGLVDGNDGAKQSGTRIPEPAKEAFEMLFFRAHQPNLTLIYEQVCARAKIHGWGPMPCRKTFERYAESFSEMYWQLTRVNADSPREVLPYVRRDPTSIPVYHTLQGDSRQLDNPVQCGETKCPICGIEATEWVITRRGKKKLRKLRRKLRGHYPIWTIWVDTHSRWIVDWELTIEAPTSRHILASVRRMIAANGLMKGLYVDNGGPYVKALRKKAPKGSEAEKGIEETEQLSIAGRFDLFGIDVTFARPFNAQGKGIVESTFKTFRRRFDEQFESFRGPLGKKSEKARELLRKPAELPMLSELAYQLQLAVDRYHHTAHHGFGMNGRTPHEVWTNAALRLPLAKPDPRAFSLLFFEPVMTPKRGRIVGQLGVQVDKQMYRLAVLEKQFQYYGERVDVRINPDDPREAILLDMKTGRYICDARLDDEFATYVKRDPVTRALIARSMHEGHALLRMAGRSPNPETAKRIEEHARLVMAYYEQLRDSRRRAFVPAGEAAGAEGTLVLLSRMSHIARDRERGIEEAQRLSMDDFTFLLDADQLHRWRRFDEVPPLELVAPAEDDGEEDQTTKAEIRKREQGLCAWSECEGVVGESRVLCTRHEELVVFPQQ